MALTRGADPMKSESPAQRSVSSTTERGPGTPVIHADESGEVVALGAAWGARARADEPSGFQLAYESYERELERERAAREAA